LSVKCRKRGVASFVPLFIREIREIRGPSSGPYSGCPAPPPSLPECRRPGKPPAQTTGSG
jgi:hypothetical protein